LLLLYPAGIIARTGFKEEKSKLKEGDRWDKDNIDRDNPWDLQAGHGTHIASIIYAREFNGRR